MVYESLQEFMTSSEAPFLISGIIASCGVFSGILGYSIGRFSKGRKMRLEEMRNAENLAGFEVERKKIELALKVECDPFAMKKLEYDEKERDYRRELERDKIQYERELSNRRSALNIDNSE
jgi:hypothetical protein